MIVAICQFGGEFVTKDDGNMSYTGGEAHAISISGDMLYDDLKSEITSMFKFVSSTMCIQYFLPINKRTLITVSSDKDLERMVDFHADSLTIDIYVSNKGDDRSIALDSGTSIVDTAAADRICRTLRANTITPEIADKIGKRASRGRTSVTDSSTPENATGKTSENARHKRPKAAENTAFRIVDDDLVEPAIITPTIHVNTQERVIFNNIEEENEANPDWGISVDTADDIGSQHSLDVGQEFDNAKVYRDELYKYAFTKGFKFKCIENDKRRVTAKCASENCPWRVHASQSARKQKFIIKIFNNVHACAAESGEDSQGRARKWLASFIRKKVLDNPECKPRDIARDIYEEFGFHLAYRQAWQAKETAQKEIHMLQQEAHQQLLWLCEQVMGTNPGSVTVLATSVDAKFRRCFVSFYALLNGFEHGCRPLIFLDRVCLKVNNYWKLLVAASVDGDDKIFPVAFATVEDETPSSWHWFLVQLKYAITSHEITIVSGRQKGLGESVPRVFENCYHCYSLFHLIEDLKAVLKKGSWSAQQNAAIVGYLKGAAQAYLVDDFNEYMDKINDISKDIGEWVMSTKPDSWSNAHFKGSRYDHLSSDIIDSVSKWITMKDESSAVQIMDTLLVKMMDVICLRKQASSTWEDTLTPSVEKKLQKEMNRAHKLNVICSSETVFEVRCSTINVVDIGSWECTCRRWQITGLPCMHAISVVNHLGRSVYDYCSKYFRRERYVATYSTPIQPIMDINLTDFLVPSTSYPPTKRPRGRPKRKHASPCKTSVRPIRCSRCGAVGHNKVTCNSQLL